MSHVEFYPYPVSEDAIELAYEVKAQDASSGDRRIRLQDVPENEHVCIELEARMEDGALCAVLPESEQADPPTAVVVTVRSLTARFRKAVRLSPAENAGLFVGTVEFDKRDVFGTLVMEPAVVRTARGSEPGYAQHVGARLAWGPSVVVEIDDSPIPPGGYLEIQFEDFRTSVNHRRRSNPDLLYLLDTDRDTPMLWLNSGIDHFKTVMQARGRRGHNIRVRDAMFDTIVSQAWTSLVSIVITRLAAQRASDEDVEQALESLTEWEERVLNYWAPRLVPDASDRFEALCELAAQAGSRDEMPGLQEALGMAVQRQARTAHAFKGLIRLRDLEGV